MKFATIFCLLGVGSMASAQSTWNYHITDAGNGNSLVTWYATGTVTAQPPFTNPRVPGAAIAVSIDAQGIFNDAFSGSGSQLIPTPDGSYFYTGDIYRSVVLFTAINAPASGNDNFALLTPPGLPNGVLWDYHPGTQTALIPIDFSNFNPGTYQSVDSAFTTLLTVTLTVEPVPEPASHWLFATALPAACVGLRRFFKTPAASAR